jgi:transcriptional regulator with XRE-family HTH domain
MTAVKIPGLFKKLRYLYACSELKQRSLAERIGYAETTVSGWARGTRLADAGTVSERGFGKLVDVLVDVLGGTADPAKARRLWLGSEAGFARALNASPVQRFLDLLAAAERRPILTYLSGAAAGQRMVTFSEPPEASRNAVRAAVGERFALRIKASPGEKIVLLVESAVGCHLGVPGQGAPSEVGRAGGARLPDFPGLYRFDEPRGLHRFLAFAIKAAEPLSIATCAERQMPLAETDIEMLVEELCDKKRVISWALDTLLVDVR